MKSVVLTVIAILMIASVAGGAIIYAGAYNVAAADPHWPVTYQILETARVRSIKAHAAGIVAPAGFNEAGIAAAAGHYSAHCAVCHGGPGVERDDFAGGMYPQPPDLKNVSKRYTQAELFWILKNGIKMSGMPSMADDGDEMLWQTVGFLEKLPNMSPGNFNELRQIAQSQGEGHGPNMGDMSMKGMNMPGKVTGGGDHHSNASDQPKAGSQQSSEGHHSK